MAARIKTGDIIQILTSEGIAYAQVTHKNKQYGYLIRIFSGFFESEPKDFSLVVDVSPQFSTFFPIQHVVKQGLMTVVSNVSVSAENQIFPTFRTCVFGKNGERGPWWLWNGDEEIILDRELTESEKLYPVRGIISAPLLVERIEKRYRAETHDF